MCWEKDVKQKNIISRETRCCLLFWGFSFSSSPPYSHCGTPQVVLAAPR